MLQLFKDERMALQIAIARLCNTTSHENGRQQFTFWSFLMKTVLGSPNS